jgi:hypothetical protein
MSEPQTTEPATEPVAPPSSQEPVQLPEDHPLVRTLAAQKEQIRDLKGAKTELDEIKEAQKSEAEKAADRIRELESEVPAARLSAFREAAVKFGGIDSEDAELFLTASDEQTLLKQAERLMSQQKDTRKTGNVVPREGASTSAVEPPERELVRALFNGQ